MLHSFVYFCRLTYYEQGTQVKRSLAISSWGDAAIWLLDPKEQDTQGEWAGGCWASWIPGMNWTATSFAQLMEKELEDFVRLRDDDLTNEIYMKQMQTISPNIKNDLMGY
ncbi:MAG: hypothetical protein KI793_12890 [Rivularia sp. (in: Bacteria)]|nr:hypothetical protein [Rivularia sp. MS3]